MRQYIREGVVWFNIMQNIEPNFSAMSRQFNCDYRTVKADYLEGINQSNEGPVLFNTLPILDYIIAFKKTKETNHSDFL